MPEEFEGEPTPEATPPEPDVAPEVPAWSGPSQEEWQQTQSFLSQIAGVLPGIYEGVNGLQPKPEESQAPEYDPFDPASVDAYMNWKLEQRLSAAFDEHLGPFQGLLGMMASEKGEALARSELESIKGDIGDFDQDTAYLVASGIIERGGDPSDALRQAATFAHDFEERIRADEREKFQQQFQQLGQAPGEITGGAQTTEAETIPTGPNRYQEAVERALARRRPVMPTG